jgi:hypothetical protein
MSDNKKPVTLIVKSPADAAVAVAKALPVKDAVAVKDAAAPIAQKLPDNITRTGVGKVNGIYNVVVGDTTLPFKVPAWAEMGSDQVVITVGQPSKKWLGQNGGVELKMTVCRSARGSVVVMQHAKGVIVHAYPDSHKRSRIQVENL